mgnify:CR=1 FL=1
MGRLANYIFRVRPIAPPPPGAADPRRTVALPEGVETIEVGQLRGSAAVLEEELAARARGVDESVKSAWTKVAALAFERR